MNQVRIGISLLKKLESFATSSYQSVSQDCQVLVAEMEHLLDDHSKKCEDFWIRVRNALHRAMLLTLHPSQSSLSMFLIFLNRFPFKPTEWLSRIKNAVVVTFPISTARGSHIMIQRWRNIYSKCIYSVVETYHVYMEQTKLIHKVVFPVLLSLVSLSMDKMLPFL